MYQPGKIHCYVSSSITATRNMEFEIRRGGFSSSFFSFFLFNTEFKQQVQTGN